MKYSPHTTARNRPKRHRHRTVRHTDNLNIFQLQQFYSFYFIRGHQIVSQFRAHTKNVNVYQVNGDGAQTHTPPYERSSCSSTHTNARTPIGLPNELFIILNKKKYKSSINIHKLCPLALSLALSRSRDRIHSRTP